MLEFSGEERLNHLNWLYLCIWHCYTHLKLRAVPSLIWPFPNNSGIHLTPCLYHLRPSDKSRSCSTGCWWAQEVLLFTLFLYLKPWGEVASLLRPPYEGEKQEILKCFPRSESAPCTLQLWALAWISEPIKPPEALFRDSSKLMTPCVHWLPDLGLVCFCVGHMERGKSALSPVLHACFNGSIGVTLSFWASCWN